MTRGELPEAERRSSKLIGYVTEAEKYAIDLLVDSEYYESESDAVRAAVKMLVKAQVSAQAAALRAERDLNAKFVTDARNELAAIRKVLKG